MNCWYKQVCLKEDCNVQTCLRYIEMEYLCENSNIPKNQWYPKLLDAGVDYEEYCQLACIKDNIMDFVVNGYNLYICSNNTGNGKTSWAIKLMLKYFDSIWAGNGFKVRGLFVHVPTLLLDLKNFENPVSLEYRNNLKSCPLIIWDDIASTDLSNYDLTQLLQYIDNRVLNRLSNIYTGNITSKEKLSRILGDRLSSRIWNTSKIIQFKGKDRRKW